MLLDSYGHGHASCITDLNGKSWGPSINLQSVVVENWDFPTSISVLVFLEKQDHLCLYPHLVSFQVSPHFLLVLGSTAMKEENYSVFVEWFLRLVYCIDMWCWFICLQSLSLFHYLSLQVIKKFRECKTGVDSLLYISSSSSASSYLVHYKTSCATFTVAELQSQVR